MHINVADRELCEKLHVKYGWDAAIPAWWARSNRTGQWTVVPSKTYKTHEFHDEPGAGDFYDHLPAYDLDFLLEKLPKRGDSIESVVLLGRNENNKGWAVTYLSEVYVDERASNAVAKLLLAIPDSVKELL